MFFSRFRLLVCVCLSLLSVISIGWAAPDDVTFPPPVRSGGLGIFSSLQARRDVERFDSRLLHWEGLGNILWAACGVNRPDDATARTVPILTLPFPVTIYLLAEAGVWQYDALGHRLIGVQNGDFRELATTDAMGHDGMSSIVEVMPDDAAEDFAPPVVLLLVAEQRFSGDGNLMQRQSEPSGLLVQAALHAGHVAQNIQLVGIAERIGVRTHYPPADREALIQALEIPSETDVLLVLQLGYPAAR